MTKVALLGYGVEGQAAFTYYRAQGADVTICDERTDVVAPQGAATHLGPDYLRGLDEFDVLVRTAGMPQSVILAQNPSVGPKITTVVNEFLRVCPTKNVIGVTGTKGKGTTSTLITKILGAAGKQVFLGGNIGVAPLSFLPQLHPESWVVLELSSYQLSDIQHSPHIGVCLLMAPDHLNWHGDMPEYVQAKSRMFAQQTSSDVAIYYAANATSQEVANAGAGRKIPYCTPPGAWVNGNNITIDGQEICRTDELKLLGKHNWQNACAAVTAVWEAGIQDVDTIRTVLTTFAGLEHRIEYLGQLADIHYYNDSFASNPEATIAAVQAVPQRKIVIVGGFDRMLPLDHLVQELAGDKSIYKLLLVGASVHRLSTALDAAGFTNYQISSAQDMKGIVKDAQALAKPGDAIVLSPGFASFDMFKNFEDRGEQFKKVVQTL